MRNTARWLAAAALVCSATGMAHSAEPSLTQVYEAVHAGKSQQAQVMMQQVLVAHPNSAKAHFVQAELSAGMGNLGRAREELALADKLAPGLPFAKPEAVQKLRTHLGAGGGSAPATTHTTQQAASLAPLAPPTAPPFPLGLALALGGGLAALGIYTWGKKPNTPQRSANPMNGMGAPIGSGLSRPYTQPHSPGHVPADNGLGGRVMGGLVTGLAVGAGVMAAQAIGKSWLNRDDNTPHTDTTPNGQATPIASNQDFGGDNFGVTNPGSWDDGNDVASTDVGGDGWDS